MIRIKPARSQPYFSPRRLRFQGPLELPAPPILLKEQKTEAASTVSKKISFLRKNKKNILLFFPLKNKIFLFKKDYRFPSASVC
uniref:hypothetical protein n=1 Tax=Candidatus Electronema sp. TaxID=2698783 RepID=UPI004055F312